MDTSEPGAQTAQADAKGLVVLLQALLDAARERIRRSRELLALIDARGP